MGRLAEKDVMPELGRAAPILSAFFELSTERQVGMGIGPIPMSAIRDYLERYGLPVWWTEVITASDGHFLSLQSKTEPA